MEKEYAFLDEYGSYGFNFDTEGNTTHFIITAIVIPESKIRELEDNTESIRKNYFNPGEMKSKSIGGNHQRRMRILSEISKLDFNYCSIVIDKRELLSVNPGCIHKKSFYKFLNNRLYRELKNTYHSLQMVTDNIGTKEFMSEFKKYVFDRTEKTLFDTFDFGFDDSKNNILIQLADIICGTLSYIYQPDKQCGESRKYKKILSKKQFILDYWPIKYESYIFQSDIDNKYNAIIKQLSLQRVNSFISLNENSDNDVIIEQLRVAKYLRFCMIDLPDSKYVPTKVLINILSSNGKKLSSHYLRTKIIAKLRDQGVIISSSTQGGYKLPENESELYSFINHGTTVVIPMLRRIKICRDSVKMATNGELDVIDHNEYQVLKNIFDDLEE